MRQALNYATDKDAINKTVYFGQAKVANAPIPPGMYQATDLPGYPFDLDKAKQLMKESSAPNGFKLEMQVRSGNAEYANVATIVKDQWAKIGVNVNIQNLETSVVRTNYREGNYQSQPSGWTNDMNDPTQIVNYEMRGGAGTQFAYWTRYNNPELNDMITKADLELDPAKRGAMYAEIQKIFQEDCAGGLARLHAGHRGLAELRRGLLHRRPELLPVRERRRSTSSSPSCLGLDLRPARRSCRFWPLRERKI